MQYAQVAVNLPINKLFDYLIPEAIPAENILGARVVVPFGAHTHIGIVVAHTLETKAKKIKPILKLIDSQSLLTPRFLELAKAVSDYYCGSLGQALFTALALGLRKGLPVSVLENNTKPTTSGEYKVTFVQGDSFEKRLEKYSEFIEAALVENKSIIILSPEIKGCIRIFNALTPKYTTRIAFTYRKQKMKEELALWEKARNSAIDILVGTRPAIFAPFINAGLIIIDEEDAYGYKEEQAPYYHARKVALLRGQLEKAQVVLGGALPSLESYYCLQRKKYDLIELFSTAVAHPKITIVDMRHYGAAKTKTIATISPVLEDKLRKAILLGKRAIIFVNKKGFASACYCQKCGYVLRCSRCSSRFVFHFEEKKLICNSCGLKKDLITICPECSAHYIRYMGIGIEKVISQLALIFPALKICRLDKEHQTVPNDFQILVATEMLFHQEQIIEAEIIALLDIDSMMQIVNFMANEKLYALLYRCRNRAKEEIVLQTRIAAQYQRKEFTRFDLRKLFQAELKDRKALQLPPFSHLGSLNLRGKNQERAKNAITVLYEKLKNKDKKIQIFEPMENTPFKLRGSFRYQILLKAKNPLTLSNFLRKHLKKNKPSGVITTVDIDPQ